MDDTSRYVRPFEWTIHEKKEEPYEIECWSHTRESRTTLVRIRNFLPFVHFMLPNVVNGRPFIWDQRLATILITELNEYLRNAKKPFRVRAEKFLAARDWYYFDPNETKTPFVRLSFADESSCRSFCYLMKNAIDLPSFNGIELTVCDNFIPYYYKLLAVLGCQTSGWIDISRARMVTQIEKRSTLVNEFIINWTEIMPVPEEMCALWTTDPKVGVYDDENFSDKYTRLPDPSLASNCVFMSSLIIGRLSNPIPEKKYLFFLGDMPDNPEYNIICKKTEMELIDATFKVMADEDVDMYAGFNIFGWDNHFRNVRYERRHRVWPSFSRIIGHVPDFVEMIWESSAYGTQRICYPNAKGRICFDAMYYVKRDYKFEENNLNFIAKELVGETKLEGVSPQLMFARYAEYNLAYQLREADPARYLAAQEAMKQVADYCVQDSMVTFKIMRRLNIWTAIIETASIMCVRPFELYTRGQQLRVISQLFGRCLKSGIVMRVRKSPELKLVGAVVNDSKSCIHNLVIGLDFKSLYPSIIMAYNIDHSTLVKREHWNDPRLRGKVHRIAWKESEFGDKFRFERNYAGNDDAPFEEDGYVSDDDMPADTKPPTKDAEYEFRWRIPEDVEVVQPDGTVKVVRMYEGELPKMEREMLNNRNAIKAQMKNFNEDTVEYGALDVRQNGCKVSMNSGYGTLGSDMSKASLIEGAMCVTAIGRRSILMVNDDVETCGAAYLVDFIPQYEKMRDIKVLNQYLIDITKFVAQRTSKDLLMAREFFEKHDPANTYMIDIFDQETVADHIYNVLYPLVVEFAKMSINGATPEETAALKYAKKLRAKELLPNICKVVYNDTDSSLVTFFLLKDSALVYLFGAYLAKRISELFPPPMEIDFEKVYYVLAVIKKKKYQGILLTGRVNNDDKSINWEKSFKPKIDETIFREDGTIDYEKAKKGITKKGVATARRDWTKILQKIFWLITVIGLLRRPVKQALDAIQDAAFSIMQRRVPYEVISHIMTKKEKEYEDVLQQDGTLVRMPAKDTKLVRQKDGTFALVPTERTSLKLTYHGGLKTQIGVEWDGQKYINVEKVISPLETIPVFTHVDVVEVVDGVEHHVKKLEPVMIKKLFRCAVDGKIVEEYKLVQKTVRKPLVKSDEDDDNTPLDELSPFIYLLTNTKGYSGKYAENSNSPMKRFAERSAARGQPFMPGDRIRYLQTMNLDDNGRPIENEPQGNRYRTPAQYLADAREGKCKLDLRYYIEKQMTNSIEQLLMTCYEKDLDMTKLPDRNMRRIQYGAFTAKQFVEVPTKPCAQFVTQILRIIDAKSNFQQELEYFMKCDGYPKAYLGWRRAVFEYAKMQRQAIQDKVAVNRTTNSDTIVL